MKMRAVVRMTSQLLRLGNVAIVSIVCRNCKGDDVGLRDFRDRSKQASKQASAEAVEDDEDEEEDR